MNKDTEKAYPCDYIIRFPKPLYYQIHLIAGMWGLDANDAIHFAKNLPENPSVGEGWLVFPKISAIAQKYFPQITDPSEIYVRCIDLFAEIYKKYYGIHFDSLFTYQSLHTKGCAWKISQITSEALDVLENKQLGDIIIIPSQNGSYYQKKSPKIIEKELKKNEFGLHTIALGSAFMVYPELCEKDCTGIFAIGDKLTFENPDILNHPIFEFHYMEGKYEWLRSEKLSLCNSSSDNENAMIATGFLLD